MAGTFAAAITSLERSSELATFSSESPVGSTKCALAMPSSLALAFMAATQAAIPPG
jgi:hypothetical protein